MLLLFIRFRQQTDKFLGVLLLYRCQCTFIQNIYIIFLIFFALKNLSWYLQHKIVSIVNNFNLVSINQYFVIHIHQQLSFIYFNHIFQNIQLQYKRQIMPGKKWCEYCRINLPYEKKAIQEHESTRLHMQNKQKHIKFERIKIIKQQKAAKQSVKANQMLSTANIPKAKKGSALQKQINQYKNDVIMNGKMAIHQLIAEKTQGLFGAPIQYPNKEDLVLAQNYIDQKQASDSEDKEEQNFQMWKIDICQQTGEPCFVNKITKMKLFEPPKGYILSQEQIQQWEQVKRICSEMPAINTQQAGEIGGWEQVVSEDDYFQLNRAQSSQQPEEQQKKQEVLRPEYQLKKELIKDQNVKKQVNKSWMEDLKDKINNDQMEGGEVFETMVKNTLNECRNMKEKNETLKKLIKHDIQIHRKIDSELQRELQMRQNEEKTEKKTFSIKPKKKVKTIQLTDQRDIV